MCLYNCHHFTENDNQLLVSTVLEGWLSIQNYEKYSCLGTFRLKIKGKTTKI